jgi:hypothetical protein
MSSYPRALSYYLTRLNNFSRQKLKLQTLANTTFNANQQIVIELPQGLIDMDTFTLQGLVNTNGTGVYLPFAEGMIDSISVEVGGISIQNGFTNYAELFNIFRQYQMEDKRNFRKVLQLEDRYVNAAAGTTDNTPIPFAIYNFLGFLSSVRVLDTTLMPPVKIYIRLAPNSVVIKHGSSTATAAQTSYTLTDVRATVDILDVADGVYYNMVSQRLAQAPLEIPFDNYQTVISSLASPTQSTRWSTSTDCLTGIIATFKTATPDNNAVDGTINQSEYFVRGTKDTNSTITTSVFKVNGVPYPTFPCEMKYGDVFIDTAHTLGAALDTVGATDASMFTHLAWGQKYFVHAHSFTYPDSEDAHRLTGLSGRTNQLLGSWDTTGSGNNLQPIVWLKCKSVLRIGSGKFVEIVL